MGFIVKQPIETVEGNQYDEFYVRIEAYQIIKIFGELGVTVAHYDSPESAKLAMPDYLEDSPTGNFTQINVMMAYKGEMKEWPMWYRFPLTEKVMVTETKNTSTWHPETVEYIDFDENGNEVVKTKEEWFETVSSETVTSEKTKKNLDLIGENVYEYAYTRLREVYSEIFGSENIIDSI